MLKFRKAIFVLIAAGLTFAAGYASAVFEDLQAEITRLERLEPSPDKQAEALLRLGLDYFNKNRFDDAEVLYRRAVAVSEGSLGATHSLYALSLGYLASLYDRQSRYSDAEPLYRRSLAAMEKVLGPVHPRLVQPLDNLAGLYRDSGRFAEAESLYKRVLAIRERSLGPIHRDVATSLYNLAGVYGDQDKFMLAEPLYKRLLAIREKTLGPLHPDVANALGNFAQNFFRQRKYVQAEPLYKRALAIREKVLGPVHRDVAQSLNNLAVVYRFQGQYAQAEPLLKRSLAILEKSLGSNHRDVAVGLENLALLYDDQGQYEQAESLLKRALAIREQALGPVHLGVATSLNNLAMAYRAQGHYARAEALILQSLPTIEKTLGANHPDVAVSLNNLASLYHSQGQYGQAEMVFKRSLAILEKALGPDHPDVAMSLNNLADVYQEQAQYEQAEPLHIRSLAIREKALGTNHRDVAGSLVSLARLYDNQGKYVQAESLFKRAFANKENALGPAHPDVGKILIDLAAFYLDYDRYLEAESLLKRSLAILEKALGPDHPDVAMSLNSLARLYDDQGQYAQAEVYHKRALTILEASIGSDHRLVAMSLNNLGRLYQAQGLYAQAEPLFKQSLVIMEKALGPGHPEVATILNNLARLYHDQGNYELAESLFKRSFAIRELALGPDHPSLFLTLNNLASLYHDQGLYEQAEPLFKRALSIIEKARPRGDSFVATILNNLAKLSSDQNLFDKALIYSRSATAIYRGRILSSADKFVRMERQKGKSGFLLHLSLLDNSRAQDSIPEIARESFTLVQLIQASETAYALAKSIARFSAPSDELSDVVRRDQDARVRYQRLDEDLDKALSALPKARKPEKENGIRLEMSLLDKEIARLDKILAERFPDYAALIGPEPLPLEDAQKLLRPGEALLVYALEGDRAYLWVVRPNIAQFLPLTVKPSQVAMLSNRIRASLGADNPLLTPFDGIAAHELYREIFAPAVPYLNGVTDILVVPSGPLTGLPLGVLVDTPPKEGTLKLEDHRQLDWLMKRYNFSTLPAVISLKALRMHGKPRLADQLPFFGIGDPVLEGDAGETRGGKSAPVTGLFPRRGSMANVDALRKLPSLPDTNDELQAISKTLGGDTDALYLRERATESNAKMQSLERYRVLAFATHGLIGGESADVAEPGLVLTPPQQGTIDDDGYLGASEVALLKLNADWVVLSACNTASADGTPGAAGLTGLAKAFFYAGARALLVSHWPVISSATTRLITDTFQNHAKNPDLGKSAALRQAMLDMMNDAERPEQAHPAFWAPFVVVGDGL